MVTIKSLRRQAGAAILLALLIMTLVATLAAGMVWLQWRGIQVESAERARTQAEWLLNASLDWGNLILRSQTRTSHTEDDLGQPWATPLAETKLSSFLSADGNHSDDGGPEAFLSGQITDAEGKYNLYNIVLDPSKNLEIQRLAIICAAIGIPPSTASTIGAGLRESWSAYTGQASNGTTVLMPVQVADLAWYGIDPKVIKQLEPFVELLPLPVGSPLSTINANTAPPEVLMGAIPVISRSDAQQIVLARQTNPFTDVLKVWNALHIANTGPTIPPTSPPLQVDVKSFHFEIFGQLRYEQHIVRERSVVWRPGAGPLQVLRRERIPPDPA